VPATDFGVTVSDVVGDHPLDAGDIGPNTEPLSSDDIERYIEEASAKLAGQLRAQNVNVDALDDDGLQQVQTAIKYYCIAESIDGIAFLSERGDKYREKYRNELKEIVANSHAIESGKVDFRTTAEPAQEPRHTSTSPDFTGRDYEW
jgi:hypothetical protein